MAGKRLLRVCIFSAAILLPVAALVHSLANRKNPYIRGRTLTEWLKAYNECPMPQQAPGSGPITVPTPEMEAIGVKIKALPSNAVQIFL